MSVEPGLAIWKSLADACPHPCRIHLSGGEPFGDWSRLIELAQRAYDAGLSSPGGNGPLDKAETNAFWATDETIVRDRIAALAQAGMNKLAISADPYHQQFVPIERCRLAARAATRILGLERVQVRWRDWLTDGFDTNDMPEPRRQELFAQYAATGRDRFNGRAAESLSILQNGVNHEGHKEHEERKEQPRNASLCELRDLCGDAFRPCRESLLRGQHVHIDADGLVMPGTCAGIVMGRLALPGVSPPPQEERAKEVPTFQSVRDLWQALAESHAARPIVGRLASGGPAALLDEAIAAGFSPRAGYRSKCHLCWEIRRYFATRGLHKDELAPTRLYHLTS